MGRYKPDGTAEFLQPAEGDTFDLFFDRRIVAYDVADFDETNFDRALQRHRIPDTARVLVSRAHQRVETYRKAAPDAIQP